MKILQVNNVYGHKSTGKLTKLLHDALRAQGIESLVAFGRGPDTTDPGVIRLCPDWYGKLNNLFSRFTGMVYGGCFLSTTRLIRLIRREKPDVVHLQCINGYFVNIYRLIRWLKNNHVKTVVSLHAEFMYTANCGHAYECRQWKHGCVKCPDKKKATKSLFFDHTGRSWQAMRRAFAGFEKDCLICPVSPWTQQRAMQSDILKDFRFCTVYNGVDETVFCPGEEKCKQKNAVHVTAHFSLDPQHGKGGWYVAELAKRMPQIQFYVAGPAEEGLQLPENVKLLGMLTDQKKLRDLYRQATLSLLTSRRETFSMPCAESLCCGTPVVGFEAGAPELIALKDYSQFVPFGDLDALEQCVRSWMAREDLQSLQIAQQAKQVYGVENMVCRFVACYTELL